MGREPAPPNVHLYADCNFRWPLRVDHALTRRQITGIIIDFAARHCHQPSDLTGSKAGLLSLIRHHIATGGGCDLVNDPADAERYGDAASELITRLLNWPPLTEDCGT